MARYTAALCRFCRREKQKLFFKGERCYTDKCSFDRRSYPPGMHGFSRKSALSEYALQLREKQKVKRVYGMLEKQFMNSFRLAAKKRGIISDNFFQYLESRLDNIVYRVGFARSRNEARHLIRYNHILVNNKRLNIPSYQVKINDIISLTSKQLNTTRTKLAVDLYKKRAPLTWFEVDHEKLVAKILAFSTREDIQLNVKEHLIVELYSRSIG